MAFATPSAPGGGITWSDHKGALLIIDVKSFEGSIATSFGATDAVKADVAVIDGPGAPAEYSETLIFPKLLVSQTKSREGEKLLGRLAQGTAKAGQSAPWLLNEADPEDFKKAEQWVAQRVSSKVTSAAPPF